MYPRLQINEDGARDILVVVSLIEEDVFPVVELGVFLGVFFQDAIGADAMLLAQLFPKLCADYLSEELLWFPHCPT